MSVRLERLGEDANQIGAVRGKIRRAEFPPVIAAALARGETAALPVADVEKVGLESDCLDGVVQSERTQRLDGIGREIEAGADFAQRAGLFADDGFGAALLQRQRSGKAADAAADNGDARFAWHGRCPPARLVVTLLHSMRTDAPRECNSNSVARGITRRRHFDNLKSESSRDDEKEVRDVTCDCCCRGHCIGVASLGGRPGRRRSIAVVRHIRAARLIARPAFVPHRDGSEARIPGRPIWAARGPMAGPHPGTDDEDRIPCLAIGARHPQFGYHGHMFAPVHLSPFYLSAGMGLSAMGDRRGAAAVFPGSGLLLFSDWATLGLDPPPPGAQWVRYGPDLLLVDVSTGNVIEVRAGRVLRVNDLSRLA